MRKSALMSRKRLQASTRDNLPDAGDRGGSTVDTVGLVLVGAAGSLSVPHATAGARTRSPIAMATRAAMGEAYGLQAAIQGTSDCPLTSNRQTRAVRAPLLARGN